MSKNGKKCPKCGKKVAPLAQYCIYCSAKFDDLSIDPIASDDLEHTKPIPDFPVDQETTNTASSPFGKRMTLIVSLLSFAVIAAVIVLILFDPFTEPQPAPAEPSAQTPLTTTTRDAAKDARLQTFVGQWYDESSVGKKDVRTQGGQLLYIHEIVADTVTFDLVSYAAEESGSKMALAMGLQAELEEDTLHFTFLDDGCGHSGEGFMRLSKEDVIELEVLIDDADTLAEDEHSLATCSVFKRSALPTSEGYDLKTFTKLEEVKAVAGPQTADPVSSENGHTTYTFGMLTVIADENGLLQRATVNYDGQEDKTKYCFECVDGTMTYDIVKTYFGEATHDYVEQPTDIRVLHYVEQTETSVTFTFDAQDNLLMYIDYIP